MFTEQEAMFILMACLGARAMGTLSAGVAAALLLILYVFKYV